MLSIYWDQREASLIIYCRQYHHFYLKYELKHALYEQGHELCTYNAQQ